jgi:hypothetical protein
LQTPSLNNSYFMKKTYRFLAPHSLFFFLLVLFTNLQARAQSIWTNPITDANPSASNPFVLGDVFDPNITVSGISRGPTINPNAGGNRYNATAWPVSPLGIDLGDYFSLTLTPNAGYEIDFTNWTFKAQVSATGPVSFAVRSSLDGFTSDIYNPVIPNTALETGPYVASLVAPGFQNITTPITFRIYGWGGTGAAGTFSINEFTFNGSVNPTCTVPVLSTSVTNVLCNGNSTGAIDLTTTGGTFPFSYAWAGPGSFSATTEDISGVPAGTYTVTVTATGGCTTSTTATITEPAALNLTTTNTNPLCNGANTGSIDLTVSGGVTSYSYSWSHGPGTQDVSALGAGTYTVTVTDGNLCTASTSVTITQPAGINISAITQNADCNGATNGSIDLTVTGGTPTYDFNWSNSDTTEDITGLVSGVYTVTVTDGNGCSASSSITVNQPPTLILGANATQPSCSSVSNGSIDLFVTGGSPSYSYLWNTTATTEDIGGLPNGTYSVTVTDNNGCSATATVSLYSPVNLTLSATWTNATCNGGNNASINLSVTSGIPGYTYNWSNSASTQDLTGLTAGTYTVVVTDASGCTGSLSQMVGEAGLINSFISVSACGFYTSPSGLYTWGSSGVYADTLVAANGCDSLIGIALTMVAPNVGITSFGHSFHANLAGATYQWVDCNNAYSPIAGATSQNYTSPVDGNFAVIVTDDGCSDTSACAATTNLSVHNSNLQAFISLYPNPNDGNFNLAVDDLVADYMFVEITDISGKMVHSRVVENITGYTTIGFGLTDLSPGIYLFRIYANGQSKVLRFIKS